MNTLFRPCRPWQGRRLGRRPQQQLTAGLRIAPPVGRRLGLRPTCSSVTAVAENQRRNRLCPSRRLENPGAVRRNGRFWGDCASTIGRQKQTISQNSAIHPRCSHKFWKCQPSKKQRRPSVAAAKNPLNFSEEEACLPLCISILGCYENHVLLVIRVQILSCKVTLHDNIGKAC